MSYKEDRGLEPSKWWRVLGPDGNVWCETSSQKEAVDSMRPGDKLFRLHTRTEEKWVEQPYRIPATISELDNAPVGTHIPLDIPKRGPAMDDRDELAQIVFDHADWSDSLASAEGAADAILAAGYRKTRTVTTDEELEALPKGTLIRAVEERLMSRDIGRVFENIGGRYPWLELDPGDRSDGEDAYPSMTIRYIFGKGSITVLHTPQETP